MHRILVAIIAAFAIPIEWFAKRAAIENPVVVGQLEQGLFSAPDNERVELTGSDNLRELLFLNPEPVLVPKQPLDMLSNAADSDQAQVTQGA